MATQATRILYVTDVAEIGGAERRLIDLARRIDPVRFELSFCTLSPDGPLLHELRRRGHETYSLGVRHGSDYPRAFARLVRLVRAARPSILHGQIRYAAFVAALAGRLCRVPVLVATRTYTTRLGGHAFLDRWTSRLVDTTIAVSEAACEVMLARERIRPGKVRVIPNGVNLEDFARPPAWRVEEENRRLGLDGFRVVGTVGHLHPIKGHHYLVESAEWVLRKIPRVKFLIVGAGPLHRQLADLIAARGLGEQFILAGARSDVPVMLAAMDVFALPSLNEGMSHSLLEAMALGRPVVATAVGGNREVVEPEVTGLSVPPHDAPALAQAIVSLLEDEALARRLALQARRVVEQRFSAQRMVSEYVSTYEALLAGKAVASA